MRVLGVDDEEDLRFLCRVALERLGHEFIAAKNGAEALTILRSETVDIVLLDMMMPVLDGVATLEAINEMSGDVPAVVMLTALSGPEDRVRALAAGAVDFVTKPFSPMALPDVLLAILAMTPEDRERHRLELLDSLQSS